MKKAISIIATLLWIIIAPAQGHFDWVQSWTGSPVSGSHENQIVSTVVDSEGNVYALGTFSAGGHFGNTEILPSAAGTQTHVVVAKFSANGELLWHKAVSNQRLGGRAHSMSIIGDTSIVCMTTFTLPSSNASLYFWDSTFQDRSAFIGNTQFMLGLGNCFIYFDKDGNMKKQHFLQLALVDSTGHIMSRGDFQGYEPLMNIIADGSLSRDLFNVDKYGNIYLCRQAYDIFTYDDGRTLSVQDGTIAALKIYVDGQPTHTIYPDQRYNKWNHIVMKFSPDFDSLYWSHYIFKADSNYNTHILGTSYVTSINIDNDDNFYITLNCSQARDSIINKANIPLNKSDSLFFHFQHSELWHGCMIAFNPSQEPIYIRKLTYGDTSCTTSHSHSFFSTAIDEESCSIFLLGKATFGDRFNSIPSAQFSIGGDSLDLRYNAFWCRLDKTTGRLLSYGKARSDVLTTISGSAGGASGICTLTNLVVHNNRVISEVHYQRDISFLDTTIMMASTDWGMGMMMWDYDGNEIGYVDFQSNSPTNLCGSMLLQDSVLYLAGTLTSDADLGEHHIYGSGAGRAFVAKYVDTAFMHPYVRPDLREPQSIIWEQELNFTLADSPVTLTATSTSGLPVSYSCSDTSIARIDGSTLHLLAGGSCTVLATCPDNDYYQAAAPVSKTLTVGQSGIADPEASPLLIYPNPSRGYMNLYGPTDQISSITLYDMTGREVYHHTRTIFLNATPADQGPCYSLNISHLPQGSYIVKVSTADGQEQHLKVVKK